MLSPAKFRQSSRLRLAVQPEGLSAFFVGAAGLLFDRLSRMAAAVATETFFDLPFSRSQAWPVFSRTDWLNRALGLPAVKYRTEPLAEGGSAVFASARAAGMELRWREWPFEWTEPEFYRVRREFLSGPLRAAVGGVDFLELPGGGTRLRVHSRLTPRNALGSWLARTVIGPKATRDMAHVVAHVKKFLHGELNQSLPKLPVSPVNELVLRGCVERLCRETGDVATVERLAGWLRSAPDVELTHIRPKALARGWNLDTWAMLRVMLFGAQGGLLQFRWEVLCPNCRSTRVPLTTSLSGLKRESHCDVCQIRFDAEFDKSVELKFMVHPGVRAVPEQTFCLAGPGGKPHVLSQLLLQPGETRDWKWPANGAGLRLRSPQVKQSRLCEATAGQESGRIECRPDNFQVSSDPKPDGWKISNPNPFPLQVALERVAWSDDILTAAAVTNWQVFRDLFAAEVVSPGEQITVSEQAMLFTDLRGSTAMYHDLGDARAYTHVRDHFGVLGDAIQKNHGGVVKTIGDAVMAVFCNSGDAFAAAEAMFAGIAAANRRSPERRQLVLKAGLHAGPCLAVNANDRLDYFGTTVNLAARLVDFSRGGELAVTDEVFSRAEVRARLGHRQAEANQFVPRGFARPVAIWLVPMN
jgi:adenylate cyclase